MLCKCIQFQPQVTLITCQYNQESFCFILCGFFSAFTQNKTPKFLAQARIPIQQLIIQPNKKQTSSQVEKNIFFFSIIYLYIIDYQRIIDSNNEIKKLVQPDALDNNWSKTLERYGFKKLREVKLKSKEYKQLQMDDILLFFYPFFKSIIIKIDKQNKYYNFQQKQQNQKLKKMYYAEEYSPPKIPQLKQLAIIDQNELMTLKQKKLELELKLKQKELEIKQNSKQDQNDDQENTIFKIQQPQDFKKGKGGNQKIKQTGQQQSSSTLAQMKENERIENERKEMLSKIAFLEKEKKTLQNQFDQMKESIRADNVQLKEQAIKSKSEANTMQKQKDDIENEKNAMVKENRKVKQEMKIWQDKYNDLVKISAEAEAKIKANKDVVNEREDKINWIEDILKKEKEQHKKTQERCMILVNEINQLKRDCDNFRKDKERLLDEIQQIIQKYTLKYSDLNEQVLLYQRELNEQKLGQSEFKRLLDQKSNRIKDLEFERERLLVRVQDLDRLEHKLGARVEKQLNQKLNQIEMRGTHIVEKIVHPISYEIPREVPVYPPQQDNDVVKLREDLLYLKQEKERALDEAEYWKNRYQDFELAEDRAINLMAHQNKNESDLNVKLQETRSIIFTKVMGLINDLSKIRRTSASNDVKEAIEQVLNNHNDILKYIMTQ